MYFTRSTNIKKEKSNKPFNNQPLADVSQIYREKEAIMKTRNFFLDKRQEHSCELGCFKNKKKFTGEIKCAILDWFSKD